MLSTKGTQFFQNGKPFFYLADTCWSAFTNITLEEWQYYLDFREQQGFTAIQINILSQWDASGSDLDILPFPITRSGAHYQYDFSKPNHEYFDRAEQMVAAVREHHMVPVLVLLWSNYVPGTWSANMNINNQIPFDDIEPYVSAVTERFKKFSPIYFVSGDTDFPTEETVNYYREALTVAKVHDPQALYSCHIKGRLAEVPVELLDQLDFFCYQSGHNFAGQNTAYSIPSALRSQGYRKPIINAEPCYEQISYSRNLYGRYDARNVRQASWSSVLSGANAGITYGAHGIWSWHRLNHSFGIVQGEGFDAPFDWRDALHFDGANDMVYLKTIMEQYFPNGAKPVQTDLHHEESIRVSVNENRDRYAIYLPTNTVLDLNPLKITNTNASAYVFDLNKRQQYPLKFTDLTHLAMSRSEADSVIIVDIKGA